MLKKPAVEKLTDFINFEAVLSWMIVTQALITFNNDFNMKAK